MTPVIPVVGYIAVSAYLGLHAKTYQTCKYSATSPFLVSSRNAPPFFIYLSIERRFRRDFDLKVRCKFCHLCKWGLYKSIFRTFINKNWRLHESFLVT